MFKEFKEFALKGNVADMAVGIVIGAAFTGIVNSLVKDVMNPVIGMATGGIDFSNVFLTLKQGTPGGPYNSLKAAADAGAVTINFGLFLNAIISFVIVSFALFLLVKGINRLRRKEEAAPTPPAAPPRQEVLLEEIRDLLKKQS